MYVYIYIVVCYVCHVCMLYMCVYATYVMCICDVCVFMYLVRVSLQMRPYMHAFMRTFTDA